MVRKYATDAARRAAINKRRRAVWATDPVARERKLAQHRKWAEKARPHLLEYARTYNSEYRKKNAKKLAKMKRERHLRQEYGITQAEFRRMRKAQKGRCCICQAKRPLRVDHCHSRGHVRGLLCDRCNVGLGCFKDNVRLLAAAQRYLRRRA